MHSKSKQQALSNSGQGLLLPVERHSRLLFTSNEGDTDRENYRAITWGGSYGADC